MARLGDIVLLGPRLTIGAARRAAGVAAGSVRLATDAIGGRGGGRPEVPDVDEKPEVPDVAEEPEEPEVPDVEPNVPQAVGGGFPEPPGEDPGDVSDDPGPHHSLNTPVGEPDPTEWPDPYERREDPRDPPDPDEAPFGEEPHPHVGSTSTSEPHPGADIQAPDAEPPNRDKLDD